MIDRIHLKIAELRSLDPKFEVGSPQPPESISKLESLLGRSVPSGYRAFLSAFGYCGDIFGITSATTIASVGVYAMTASLQTEYGLRDGLLVIYHDYDLKACDCIDLTKETATGECPMAFVEYRGAKCSDFAISDETFLEYLEQSLDALIEAGHDPTADWQND